MRIKDSWLKKQLETKWVDEYHVSCPKCNNLMPIGTLEGREFAPEGGLWLLSCKCGNRLFGIERRTLKYYVT